MYHYTTGKKWEQIQHGQPGETMWDKRTGNFTDAINITGLYPFSSGNKPSFDRGLPDVARKGYVYGFSDPIPHEWTNSIDHPQMWGVMMLFITERADEIDKNMVLLKVDIAPEVASGKVWVVDQALMQPGPYKPNLGEKLSLYLARKNEAAKRQIRHELFQKQLQLEWKGVENYWNSMVPFAQYDGSFSLPELITDQVIPLDRITCMYTWDTKDFMGKNFH
jgi:hypothetical protein